MNGEEKILEAVNKLDNRLVKLETTQTLHHEQNQKDVGGVADLASFGARISTRASRKTDWRMGFVRKRACAPDSGISGPTESLQELRYMMCGFPIIVSFLIASPTWKPSISGI